MHSHLHAAYSFYELLEKIPINYINHFKMKGKLFYWSPNSYWAVNTFHLGYKNKSVYVK